MGNRPRHGFDVMQTPVTPANHAGGWSWAEGSRIGCMQVMGLQAPQQLLGRGSC